MMENRVLDEYEDDVETDKATQDDEMQAQMSNENDRADKAGDQTEREKVEEPGVDEENGEDVVMGGVAPDVGSSPRCEEQPRQRSRRGPKNHPGRAEGKDLQIVALTKKLNQAKKINSELQNQLQRFYKNGVVVELENRLKEKQKRIEELMRENRTLKNSERLLSKEIEDMQNSKDNFSSKKRALQEELRVCKERIKQLKEQYRVADEKGFKLHQQSFDLAVQNKGLSEKVRLLEGATASTCLISPAPSTARIGSGTPIEGTSPEEVQTIIASQEEEITRLHQRVALMKKTHKAEQTKYERLLRASQDEIEQTRVEMEQFYQQLFAKERAARVQFLHMKKLKHALHELASTQQTNQRFQPFLANREMRITNRSNGFRHHQLGPQSLQKGPKANTGRWITEALHHLGFVMPLSSHVDASNKAVTETETPDDQVEIPENCIQGRLVPFPPSFSVDRGGTTSTRSQFYNALSTNSQSNNGDPVDVSETIDAEDNDEDPGTAVISKGTKGTDLLASKILDGGLS